MESIADMSDDDFMKMLEEQEQRAIPVEAVTLEFGNVVDDSYDPFKIEQGSHLGDMFSIIKETMSNFDDYLFIVNASNSSTVPTCEDSPDWITPWKADVKKVLIWTAGENKVSPMEKIKDSYHHIFANYYRDTEYVTSIPLGCYAISDEPPMPMEERNIDMSFVGCLNRNRLELACKLAGVSKFLIALFSYGREDRALGFLNHMVKWLRPKDYITFTPNFARGVDGAAYVNILNSSKISLCPRGWINPETFRLYESMRAGCVTITEKLPNRKYYRDIPVVQVNNWIDGLLASKKLLDGDLNLIGESNKKFYEMFLSPKATAKIITEKLQELENA